MKITHYSEREAASMAHQFDDVVLVLDMFKSKAVQAIPYFESILCEIRDGEVEERDVFRIAIIEMLIGHLKFTHKITPEELE